MYIFVIQTIIREVIKEFAYAPVWWYSQGLQRALERLQVRLHDGNQYLGWSVWVSNLFTPMYAQHDALGRSISFAVRVFQIIARSLLLLAWVVVSLSLFVLYCVLPVVAMLGIIYWWRLLVAS